MEAGRYDLAADVYQHLGASVDDEGVREQLDSELRATERVLRAQVDRGSTTPRTELAAAALTRIRETLARLQRES